MSTEHSISILNVRLKSYLYHSYIFESFLSDLSDRFQQLVRKAVQRFPSQNISVRHTFFFVSQQQPYNRFLAATSLLFRIP